MRAYVSIYNAVLVERELEVLNHELGLSGRRRLPWPGTFCIVGRERVAMLYGGNGVSDELELLADDDYPGGYPDAVAADLAMFTPMRTAARLLRERIRGYLIVRHEFPEPGLVSRIWRAWEALAHDEPEAGLRRGRVVHWARLPHARVGQTGRIQD